MSLHPRLAGAAIPEYALRTLRAIQLEGQAYLVGGCVRDLLRGVTPKDYDVACSVGPARVLELFPHTVPTGLQHGTVTVVQPEGVVEVTTFRGEADYRDGRRPERVFFLDTIEADLARRDFTINAMAFDPIRGVLVDPFGGVEDLGQRLIRCVGEADARFGEDGLRPLRAVRLAGVLRFSIEEGTLAAIPRAAPTYARVAIERVADEVRKLLRGPRPSHPLHLLASTGLASRILPVVIEEAKVERDRRLDRVNFVAPEFGLRLAALFRGQMPALDALRLPTALRNRVTAIDGAIVPGAATDSAELRRFASRSTPAIAFEALKVARADAIACRDSARTRACLELRHRLSEVLGAQPPLRVTDLALNGNEVSAILGIRGREVGNALRDLLEAVLRDPTLNTPEQLRVILGKR